MIFIGEKIKLKHALFTVRNIITTVKLGKKIGLVADGHNKIVFVSENYFFNNLRLSLGQMTSSFNSPRDIDIPTQPERSRIIINESFPN